MEIIWYDHVILYIHARHHTRLVKRHVDRNPILIIGRLTEIDYKKNLAYMNHELGDAATCMLESHSLSHYIICRCVHQKMLSS